MTEAAARPGVATRPDKRPHGRRLSVGLVQLSTVDGDQAGNLARGLALAEEAAMAGADLICLPELWTGLGYSDDSFWRQIAEPIPGPTSEALSAVARRHGCHITGSWYEAGGDGRVYNTAPMIGPDGAIIGRYRKSHLFDVPQRTDIPPGIIESARVTPGDELVVLDTALGRIGMTICVDLRFPELYRAIALQNADAIVCLSAFLAPRADHWEFLLRARATDNQVWLIASGQTGREPRSGIGFVGRSMIVDPWGVVTATASDEPGITLQTIDLDYVATVRQRWDLAQQRRPALYAGVLAPPASGRPD
ncbi:MAG: nitrilase-related carbon-nitrogen hydrolase [Alphaproteobacteria bacterium]